MTRHSFTYVISILGFSEAEHIATVTGEFIPGYRQSYLEPGEPDSFEISDVVIPLGGADVSILKLLSFNELERISEEGIADYRGSVETATAHARAFARAE